MAQKKWVRKRHKAVFSFFRFIFSAHTKIKYNYTAEKSKLKGPFLLMCNHVTTFDPVFVALSFKCPIYYCAMDDLFNIKGVSPLLRYLVAPIPKKKSVIDLQAIRDCIRVLNEGGAVGIFPEGNRTLSGSQWSMTDGVAKFVKMTKVPLVLYTIEGGYGSDPRWGIKKRKGKMRGVIRKVVQPDEYKAMSNEELYRLICENITAHDVESGIKFKSRRRAENIQRALYMCPHCGKIGTISSKGYRFRCESCNAEWTYGEDLHILPDDKFDRISSWYNWEKQAIYDIAKQGGKDIIFDDGNIEVYESIRFKKKRKIAGKRITASASGITIYDKDVELYYPFSEIQGVALVNRNKFDFYHNGVTYQIAGDKKFCPVKYVHLHEGATNN